MISRRLAKGCRIWMAALLLACFLPVCALAAQPEAEKSVTVQLKVSCTGTNTDETFRCELAPESTEFQMIEIGALSLKDGESGAFVITYTYPGTYRYTVRQLEGSDSATTYDKTVYTVDVYVLENEDGRLSAEAVVYAGDSPEKKAELQFNNEKELPPPDEPKDDSDDSDNPEKPAGPDNPGMILEFLTAPQTGDGAAPLLWAALALLAALGAAALLILKKRKREEGDQNA